MYDLDSYGSIGIWTVIRLIGGFHAADPLTILKDDSEEAIITPKCFL